jgi:hypothetical protein
MLWKALGDKGPPGYEAQLVIEADSCLVPNHAKLALH